MFHIPYVSCLSVLEDKRTNDIVSGLFSMKTGSNVWNVWLHLSEYHFNNALSRPIHRGVSHAGSSNHYTGD